MRILLQLKDLSSIAEDKSDKYTDLEKALARKALEYHKISQEKSDEANELFQSIYSSFCLFERKGFILRLMTKRIYELQMIKAIDSTPNKLGEEIVKDNSGMNDGL